MSDENQTAPRQAMMKQQRTTTMVDSSFQPKRLSQPMAAQSMMQANPNRRSQQFPGAMASQSMMVQPGQRPLATAMSHNSSRLLDAPTLPKTFDIKAVRELESDACMLCEAAFTRRIKVVNRNASKSCKRCGRAICEICSDQRRQLSREDTTLHRVCDKCDTEMDNFRLKRNHEDVLSAQQKKIQMLNNQLVQLEEDKQKLEDDCATEIKDLQSKVRAKYSKRDELTENLNKLKQQITHQNNARNLLHKSICDLENVIADLEVEQKRLMTKQNTIQTHTIDKEHQLRQLNIENQEQLQRLEALKQKVSK